MRRIVTINDLAEHLNLTPRRVQQLAKDEGMPKARGGYELEACSAFYIRYLQRAFEKREPLDGNDAGKALQCQKIRVWTARAEDAELELGQKRGTLVPIAAFGRAMAAMITHARQNLLQLPGRVAHELEHEDRATVRQKLKDAIDDALRTLAVPQDYRKPGTCPTCAQTVLPLT